MTIKQQGGVFGRNPTFNDVTIEGELTFNGDIDVNSDLKVNGDLDVIGDISGTDLDLSSATGPVLNLKNTDTNGNSGEYVGKIEFEGSDTSGGAGGVRAGVYAQYGSDFGFTSLDFQTAASGGAASSKMQIDGNGSIYVMNGNVIMSTSGSGIDFSATGQAPGSTSELLDDYEEGTWTPVLTVNGFFGGPTLSSSVATYTKVGRVVHATCRLVMSAQTYPSVYCQITGTPFVSDVGSNFVGVYDGSNPGDGTQGGVLTMGPAGIFTTPMGTTTTSTTWNFTVTYAVD